MRRRRSRGTWFPTIGTAVGESNEVANGRQFVITFAPGSADMLTAISPVTHDQPFEGDDAPTAPQDFSLADILGSEYVLQRIVGKFFATRRGVTSDTSGTDVNPAVLVGAGFFVARANDAAVGGGIDTPIGSATEAERRDNYSPLEADTVREPWIWRRTWLLGTANRGFILNPALGTPTAPFSPSNTLTQEKAGFPASTSLYGSVADGPHIDSKVKRRVSQDNRLWLAISAVPWPLGSETSAVDALTVPGYVDFRIFGSLRKAKGSSAF